MVTGAAVLVSDRGHFQRPSLWDRLSYTSIMTIKLEIVDLMGWIAKSLARRMAFEPLTWDGPIAAETLLKLFAGNAKHSAVV